MNKTQLDIEDVFDLSVYCKIIKKLKREICSSREYFDGGIWVWVKHYIFVLLHSAIDCLLILATSNICNCGCVFLNVQYCILLFSKGKNVKVNE